MRKNSLFRMKVVSLLATGAVMMQFGGCLYDGFLKQVGIGFGRGIGALPADIVNGILAGFIDPILGG
jgi:hypothetical protein